MFADDLALNDALSRPTDALIDTFRRLKGDILLLGAAGKMGPSLARMAKRASEQAGVRRRIIAASRFTSTGAPEFTDFGIEALPCDLLKENAIDSLPLVENVVYMLGRKFGSTGDESLTWAVNCFVPSVVCQRFRKSRIVAFSTGNVFAYSPVSSSGPTESTPLLPVGEYGMSALGRERMFEYFSRSLGIPIAIIRLNYACDLRYGVLVDLATKVWNELPIDLAMGHFNTIWQGDANAMTLRALDFVSSPLNVFNVTGPEVLSVRDVCTRLGARMKRQPQFVGQEAETALLSNSAKAMRELGPLQVKTEQLIDWVADWVSQGKRLLNKPTHFESRDGKF